MAFFAIRPDPVGPWGRTPVFSFWLEPWVAQLFPRSDRDVEVTVEARHEHRPDLLAWETWGDPNLWWVLAVANPDVLVDPIFDMVPGVRLRIPAIDRFRNSVPPKA